MISFRKFTTPFLLTTVLTTCLTSPAMADFSQISGGWRFDTGTTGPLTKYLAPNTITKIVGQISKPDYKVNMGSGSTYWLSNSSTGNNTINYSGKTYLETRTSPAYGINTAYFYALNFGNNTHNTPELTLDFSNSTNVLDVRFLVNRSYFTETGVIRNRSGKIHFNGNLAGHINILNDNDQNNQNDAYAIRALSSAGQILVDGNINAEIHAEGKRFVRCFYAQSDLTVNGDLLNVPNQNPNTEIIEIQAISNNDYAIAMQSSSNITINGTIANNIKADGKRRARGIHASQNMLIQNGISGHIEAISEQQTTTDLVYGISAGQNITINGNLSGNITATGQQPSVCGIYANSINIANITGTVTALNTTNNNYTTAISTKTTSTSDDQVTLSTGATIHGNINLGQDSGSGNRDTLTLRGTGSFNHDLYGIDTINLEQGDATTNDHTWHLNLKTNESNNLNTFTNLNINHGILATNGHLTTENLTLQSNSGLQFDLTNPSTDHTITVTQNTTIAGKLKLTLNADPSTYTAGDEFTLIDSNNTTGLFNTIENMTIDNNLSMAIKYDSGNTTARVTLAADGNFDNVVDALDLNLVAVNFGKTSMTWADGDFNGDGTIDGLDVDILSSHYGMSIPTTSPSMNMMMVPEPSTLAIFAIPGAFMFRRRKTA